MRPGSNAGLTLTYTSITIQTNPLAGGPLLRKMVGYEHRARMGCGRFSSSVLIAAPACHTPYRVFIENHRIQDMSDMGRPALFQTEIEIDVAIHQDTQAFLSTGVMQSRTQPRRVLPSQQRHSCKPLAAFSTVEH